MGALHEGHLVADARARASDATSSSSRCSSTRRSSAPAEDLAAYPRDEARDAALAAGARAPTCCSRPPVEEVYPAGFATTVRVAGAHRAARGRRSAARATSTASPPSSTKLLNMVAARRRLLRPEGRPAGAVVRRARARPRHPGARSRSARPCASPTASRCRAATPTSRADERERALALQPRAATPPSSAVAAGERDADAVAAAARAAMADARRRARVPRARRRRHARARRARRRRRCSSPSPPASGRARLIDNTLIDRQRESLTDMQPHDAEVEDPPRDGHRLRPALRRLDHDRPRPARGRRHPASTSRSHVVDVDNGARFETYTIAGERGSGDDARSTAPPPASCTAATRSSSSPTRSTTSAELERYEPRVVHVDARTTSIIDVDAEVATLLAEGVNRRQTGAPAMSTTPHIASPGRRLAPADDAPAAGREEAPRRADRDGHRLRLPERPGRRGGRRRPRARRRLRRDDRARLPLDRAGRRSTRCSMLAARRAPRAAHAVAGRRPAVRLLRGLRRAGDRDRAALRQGGRLRRRQARGRRRRSVAARPRDRRRRHPGDGPRRPDAADGDRARRLPRPGPHRASARSSVARDALALQEAGCFSIVFEAIPARSPRRSCRGWRSR